MDNTSKITKFSQIALRMFTFLLLSCFIGCCAYIFNAKFILHDPYPTIGGFAYSVVVSGSMEPAINVDDVIITQESDNYQVDDIVIYGNDGPHSLIVHRIVSTQDQQIITKGDANNANDKPISQEQIFGKVVSIIPGIGKFFMPLSVIVLAGAIIVLFAISTMLENRNRKSDQDRISELQQQIQELGKTQQQ